MLVHLHWMMHIQVHSMILGPSGLWVIMYA
eukprot:COSAG02_NODE_69_length_42323_cov_23.507850_38_plen_30_part_00